MIQGRNILGLNCVTDGVRWRRVRNHVDDTVRISDYAALVSHASFVVKCQQARTIVCVQGGCLVVSLVLGLYILCSYVLSRETSWAATRTNPGVRLSLYDASPREFRMSVRLCSDSVHY